MPNVEWREPLLYSSLDVGSSIAFANAAQDVDLRWIDDSAARRMQHFDHLEAKCGDNLVLRVVWLAPNNLSPHDGAHLQDRFCERFCGRPEVRGVRVDF